MNKELKKTVDSVVDLEDFSVDFFFHEGLDCALEEAGGTLLKGLSMDTVYTVGGYEGGGDECLFVVEVKINDKSLGFVQFDGWYSSYEGSEFSDNSYKEVKSLNLQKLDTNNIRTGPPTDHYQEDK